VLETVCCGKDRKGDLAVGVPRISFPPSEGEGVKGGEAHRGYLAFHFPLSEGEGVRV
jgi:hypothetical protein